MLGSKEAGSDVPLRLALRTWFERQTELKAWRPRYRTKVDAIISSYIEGEERPRLKLTPTVRKAIEETGSKPVGSISRSDVMRLVNLIKPGVGEQLMGAVLSPFFNSLYEAGIVTGNPAKNRLRVTGGRRVRTRHFIEAEFLRLWRAFEAEGDPNKIKAQARHWAAFFPESVRFSASVRPHHRLAAARI